MKIITQAGALSKAPLSSPPHPPITPHSKPYGQAKEQAKERARVRKNSAFYRYLLAETRRRAPYRVNEIAAEIVGMTCEDAKRLVLSLKLKNGKTCRRCGRQTKEQIEGYCFECYRKEL